LTKNEPVLWDVLVIFWSSIVVLTANCNYWIVPLLHSASDMYFSYWKKYTSFCIEMCVAECTKFLYILVKECVEIKCQQDATDDFYCRSYSMLNMFRGTIMPIIRSSRVLYRSLLPVVFCALVFKLSVWCGAEGCVSGLQDAYLNICYVLG
jgi:hypothetical protein